MSGIDVSSGFQARHRHRHLRDGAGTGQESEPPDALLPRDGRETDEISLLMKL